MKRLFLVRHAKSSWDDPALLDRDRPLDGRGERDSVKMGKRLAERDARIDLILSSPAKRALATAEVFARMLECKRRDIVQESRLYASDAVDLLEVIQGLDDKLKSVVLVGHNPELTALAHRFSSEITHMPTCAVAEFRFDVKSWSDLGKRRPTQVALDCPKKPT
jgi:phosphohistidine phosphatase